MYQTKSTTTDSMPGTDSTGASTVTAGSVSSSPRGCGCHHQAPQTSTCCRLTCFERPKYFCGQLLSDADLTLQETYFREKNKLYHRTLDGFGVVCGLQMRCDHHCPGHITIGDGYAIDCCGNDLLVCQPRSFDVIGELRKKKWLVALPRDPGWEQEDPDHKRQREGDNNGCSTKQCFYIGICYGEEPVDFATPYTTECNPAPGPCQPTRIREGVRFEIYENMPVRPNPLDEIGKRIECCFKMFREGQFSKGLARIAPQILELLCNKPDDSESQETEQRAARLFEELQALFLHELRTCPDPYNCDLEHQVYRLRLPKKDDFRKGALEAFTQLIGFIQKYVFSCVLNQLAFPCPEPTDPCCVLIGSVEIENGRLSRVINYPRWYLWCFANFFEVLIYNLANDAACGQKKTPGTVDEPSQPEDGCCPAFEVGDICQPLNSFRRDPRTFEKTARTSVDAMKAVYQALVDGFNFTRPGGIAPLVLLDKKIEIAEQLAREFHIDFEPMSGLDAGKRDVFGALADNTIHFGSETLFYSMDEQENKVTGVHGLSGAPAFAIGPYTHPILSDLMDRATRAEERLNKAEKEFAAFKARVEGAKPPQGDNR
jgi:hypothetical protein